MELNEKLLKLKELTNQFQSNIKQYKSNIYDEANTRVDFIDKFFELLDWDVRNLQGYSEQYREVIREDKIQIEGKQKAPDYSFRIGRERKFFVEAKKPSVNLKEDIEPAFQVRRYGYTAKLPLSILTDFEEFAIYDTRIKPDKNDKASVGRVFYCTCDEYEKHFEFIYDTFSKNAILKGSFDKYIDENKNKKGTSEVDKELLKLVEDWRTDLAKNIALRNNEIDIYNLNNAVQKIIDRLIFLRIAEDKEIENYEQLLLLTKTGDIFKNLNELFVKANKKYNAGLFKPESWLAELRIDDKVLSSIIKGLYYPECPYEFSILPIEILGNIYEQFLGKTIKFRNVKEGHTAVIEEKPEVRKAGGVYYTPQYIVNYIVENTIGEKIKDKTPDEVADLKVCDPACGSGSFLVGAYQFLLNYHIDYYTQEKNIKKALKDEKIFQIAENNYKLTIEEKQKILTNNIHGVDIDPQAVEVTKLSLYLKLLENEGKEAEGSLFKHSDLKLLPTLDRNIKCGNSLIGSDFYSDKDLTLFGNDEMRKVNVFDWDKQYPDIFKNGGFDVVIGNPPYGADLFEELYMKKKYPNSSNMKEINSYLYFTELSARLLKDSAVLGYIIPDTWLLKSQYFSFRKYLHISVVIKEIVETGAVFEQAKATPNSLLFFYNTKPLADYLFSRKSINMNYSIKIILEQINKNEWFESGLIKYSEWSKYYELQLGKYINNEKVNIINKMISASTELQKIKHLQIDRGLEGGKSSLNYSGTHDIIIPDNVYEYYLEDHSLYKTNEYKDSFKYDRIILIRIRSTKIKKRIIATIENQKRATLKTLQQIFFISPSSIDLKYILAILNSKLINYFCTHFLVDDINKNYLSSLPIPINESMTERVKQEKMIILVDQIFETQKLYHSAKIDSDKIIYKQKIDMIDNQINCLVYELYELTDEEIKIVEGVL